MVSKNIANIQIQHEWHWILDYYHLPVVCVVDQISSLHSGITNHEQIECIPISMGSYSCCIWYKFHRLQSTVLMFEMVSVQFFSNLIGFIFFSASKSKWCNGRWHGFRFSMLEFIYTVWVGKFCGFMCLSKCIVCGETDSVYVGTICLQSSMLIW